MTIAELRPASNGAPPLHTSTTMKELVYHSPGKRAWEDKPRPTIQEPADAIARITRSRPGPKASLALCSFPFPGDSPSSKLGVMSVTSIGDVGHGGSTSLQV